MLRRRQRLGLAERLSAFPRQDLPFRRAVRIRWNEHQIPFVEAESDADLAVALGAVHAHLRSAQMEIMRRIAYGRLSEVAGAVAFDIDHMLRILDFPRAVPEMLARTPSETVNWLEGFVAGVNAAIAGLRAQPEEMELFGVRPTAWKIEDVLAVARLASMDFSWRAWHRLRPLRDRPDWPQLWDRILKAQALPVPNLSGAESSHAMFDRLWAGFGRGGSNAAAVSARRSGTGGALLTSDPHLSIMAPGNWLAAGMSSPGFRIVGLMIPGLPVVTLGRNSRIAWSGTSLHAASSDLFDLTESPEPIRERREVIHVRWGESRTVIIREAEHGPIVTDSPLLQSRHRHDLALTWIGHRPSDEITSMLAMMRARTWQEFIEATEGFAVPAQNFVFADADGNVGQSMAAHLPRRPSAPPGDLVMQPEALSHWGEIVTARDLPKRYAPTDGFVASANDRPRERTPVPVGFFFSAEERIERLRTVLRANNAVTLRDLAALHRDVAMPSARAMRDLLLSAGEWEERATEIDPGACAVGGSDTRGNGPGTLLRTLREWDGVHDADSVGALAFELFLYHFIHRLHGDGGLALFRASLQPWGLLHEDITSMPRERIRVAAREAAAEAAIVFGRYRCWGDIHRIRLSHPLAAIPLLGRRYVFAEFPVGGSNETLMKTAHGLSSGPHRVGFGANARFLADLGNPDENYVVLLGGQDGWLGSSTFADQVDLWRRGAYCRLPLDPETIQREFVHEIVLPPATDDTP